MRKKTVRSAAVVLAAAMVAGLIDKSERGYNDDQIRAFLSALRAHADHGLRLNREQMETLKDYTQEMHK